MYIKDMKPALLYFQFLVFPLAASCCFFLGSCSPRKVPGASGLTSSALSFGPAPLEWVEDWSHFEAPTPYTATGGGAGTASSKQWIIHKQTGERFLLKAGSEDDWVEAYASAVYRFFLGDRFVQQVAFLPRPTGGQVNALIRLAPNFQEVWEFHDKNKTVPLLPPGNGLEGIILLAYLFQEVDLKGWSSSGSAIGYVQPPGDSLHYFRIDAAQSFQFNKNSQSHSMLYEDSFRMRLQAQLDVSVFQTEASLKTWAYLQSLGLIELEEETSGSAVPGTVKAKWKSPSSPRAYQLPDDSPYFAAFQLVARQVAHQDPDKFARLLRFCEAQVKDLPVKQYEEFLRKDDRAKDDSMNLRWKGVLEYFNPAPWKITVFPTSASPSKQVDVPVVPVAPFSTKPDAPRTYAAALWWRWNALRLTLGLPEVPLPADLRDRPGASSVP